jgi:hypothetical protein
MQAGVELQVLAALLSGKVSGGIDVVVITGQLIGLQMQNIHILLVVSSTCTEYQRPRTPD